MLVEEAVYEAGTPEDDHRLSKELEIDYLTCETAVLIRRAPQCMLNNVLTVFLAQVAQPIPWLPHGDVEHVPDDGPPPRSRGERPTSHTGAPPYRGAQIKQEADRRCEGA